MRILHGQTAISAVDEALRQAALKRLDTLTKPQGSLGYLEVIAAQLAAIQGTLDLHIDAPTAIVFAADHGIADRGVSAYPRAVTAQMVNNFLSGGAAISVLARLQGMNLWVVDAGVDGEYASHERLIDLKVRRGTRDFGREPAMTPAECELALQRGAEALARSAPVPSNVVVFGEMGIGNTASSAVLMHALTGIPMAQCVGRGTGLDDAGVDRKLHLLNAALERRAAPTQPLEWLAEYGGYEIAMLTGAIIAAASRRMLILVDGFTTTIAVALACTIAPSVKQYCIFGHCSAERGHRALLQFLQVRSLLELDMRLGEGSGAAVALSVVRCAVALFTQMATFAGAGVSEKHS